jgi:ankyrin repeat protein
LLEYSLFHNNPPFNIVLDLQQLDGPSSPLQGVTVGDNTVLHIAAISSGHYFTSRHPAGNHIEFARTVYTRNRSLLMARNKFKETPLHCAVKAENYKMVFALISFAEDENQVEEILTARNMHGETALHEAVRVGHRNVVNKLIQSESSLTGIVDMDGVSPLYLATMTNGFQLVKIFTRVEPSLVSCAGPNGKTALHAAVLGHTGNFVNLPTITAIIRPIRLGTFFR